MRVFFGLPTKALVIAVIGVFLGISLSASPVAGDEQEPLMDLQRGGVDFFKEVVPSIVEIYHSGGSGSGYVIDREGHLITNWHVTQEKTTFEVAFYGDEEHPREYIEGRWQGELVGEDPALDLAVVQVNAPSERFHPVRLGDSSVVKPGDAVATFGSPGGEPGFVDLGQDWMETWLEFYNLNLGVISEVLSFEESFWVFVWMGEEPGRTRVGHRDYGSAVQYMFHTDSAINQGNSGGPLLNAYGEAIGTNTWGLGGENMGMSSPVNLLKRSVSDLLEYGRVRRPWCGIALHPPRAAQEQYWYNVELGAMPFPFLVWFESEPAEMRIHTVNPYSPAHEAGLREGDIIRRIDGHVFHNIFDVYSHLLNGELGQEVVIEYERDGHAMPPVGVVLAEKRTRYFGSRTEIYASGGWAFDITKYTGDLTY